MYIDILTVLPDLLESPFAHSMMKRAQEKGLLTIRVHQLRKWAVNEYGQVDDYQYGGGAGMVMMCEPLAKAIEELSAERKFDEIVYMTPDGVTFNQKMANAFSLKENLLIICGHYKGIDERIRQQFVTKEISIGDFVLSGGEIPAALLVDAQRGAVHVVLPLMVDLGGHVVRPGGRAATGFARTAAGAAAAGGGLGRGDGLAQALDLAQAHIGGAGGGADRRVSWHGEPFLATGGGCLVPA